MKFNLSLFKGGRPNGPGQLSIYFELRVVRRRPCENPACWGIKEYGKPILITATHGYGNYCSNHCRRQVTVGACPGCFICKDID